jgi:predicted nucleic acid-binding protein
MPDAMTKIFIDSNVWLYRLLIDPKMNPEEGELKRRIAIGLTQASDRSIVVSTQVIAETCAVLKRKAHISNSDLSKLVSEFEEQCEIISLTPSHIKYACQLRENYQFSYWDSLIIATVLDSNATALYSEDMQHQLQVENRFQIINPFLASGNEALETDVPL